MVASGRNGCYMSKIKIIVLAGEILDDILSDIPLKVIVISTIVIGLIIAVVVPLLC